MAASEAEEAVAGAVAGAVSLVATYPLFTVTTHIQSQQTADSPTSSIVGTVKQLLKEGGLYRGCKAALLANTLQSGVYYGAYGFFKKKHGLTGAQPLWHMLASAEAGWATVLLTNPFWVVNTKQITNKQTEGQDDFVTTCRTIVKQHGWRGLYQGLVPAMLLVASPAVQFFCFELGQLLLSSKSNQRKGKRKPLSPFTVLWLAAVAKLISTLVTYPMQTVRTCLSSAEAGAGTDKTTAAECRPSTSDCKRASQPLMDSINKVVACCRVILQQQGLAGFYSGVETKLLQSISTAAILFVVRDSILRHTLKLRRRSLQ